MGKPLRERQRLAVWGAMVEEGPGGGETGTEEGPAPLLVLRRGGAGTVRLTHMTTNGSKLLSKSCRHQVSEEPRFPGHAL